MDKTCLLCAMNAYMMQEFSQRTIDGLKAYKLFKLLLLPIKSFLEVNVRKEIDKDRDVICCAAEAQKAGRLPDDTDIKRLLQRAREIDQAFLKKTSSLSSAINIQYHDIEQIRQKRIEQLLVAAYHLLMKWEETPQFRVAVGSLYSQEQFRTLLNNILQLYILETRMLSNSIKFPRRFSFARNWLIQTVHSVMERVAEELAREFTSKVYRRIN